MAYEDESLARQITLTLYTRALSANKQSDEQARVHTLRVLAREIRYLFETLPEGAGDELLIQALEDELLEELGLWEV